VLNDKGVGVKGSHRSGANITETGITPLKGAISTTRVLHCICQLLAYRINAQLEGRVSSASRSYS
jgi:hypothetical protein